MNYMKRSIQSGIRSFHRAFVTRPLPAHVAIYFHAVERAQHQSFRAAIQYWKDKGYKATDASGFCAGQSHVDNRLFISFDDNYRSWLDLLPVLKELAVRATFFINTQPFRDVAPAEAVQDYFIRIDHAGERVTLSTVEMLEIVAQGHTIGCHSHSHVSLSKLSHRELYGEIYRSKQIIEGLTGKDVVDFSYPFGMRRDFSKRVRKYCTASGFKTISAATPGLQYAPQRPDSINRSPWHLNDSLAHNLENICIDGRIFEMLTGRSAIG